LNSLMKDKMAEFIKNTLNSDIPYVPWLTGYVAIGAEPYCPLDILSISHFVSL
jgi:sodium-dependent phosphate cotransporter